MTLNFSQKVGLGFGIIIILLLTSGLSSLWNFNSIDNSTEAVNESAVPIVRESNEVQIQLLKLGKQSALAFNATTLEQTQQFQADFEENIKKYYTLFEQLKAVAASDEQFSEPLQKAEVAFEQYAEAVKAMFAAKMASLILIDDIKNRSSDFIGIIDEVGATLADITFFKAPKEHKKDMEVIAGIASRCDDVLITLIRTVEEIQKAGAVEDIERLEGAFEFSWKDIQVRMRRAADIFKPFDSKFLLHAYEEAGKVLTSEIEKKPTLQSMKIEQLTEKLSARERLDEANAAQSAAEAEFDSILQQADSKFKKLQSQVVESLDFGIKTSAIMLIVLVVLAAQNFNSMRIAIRKKVIDLNQINTLGRTIAGCQSRVMALEEVLHAMHKKIGVDNGSVYLKNDNDQFEASAYFPPKMIEGSEAATFDIGQGILGRAAETKRVIYVPDTSKEPSYTSKEKETAKALICIPLVDKDILLGVINLSGEIKKVNFSESDFAFCSAVARSLVSTIKNLRMREVIEEHNRNLEKTVEARTAELRKKNEDIANMMAHMHQGLFTITADGLIHPEYSKHLETIFSTKRIAKRNFADLMFNGAEVGVDIIDQMTTAVGAIVGEDEMMFEFNSHLLLNEITVNVKGTRKILEVDWDAMVINSVVDKLMVTVRDVTELKLLEKEAQAQKEELNIIGEIIQVDRAKLWDFFESSRQFITECRQLIETNRDKEQSVIADLFRKMHTVKGNARTYGLSHITNKVHTVESTYDAMRKDEAEPWDQSVLLEELQEAEDIVERYVQVVETKLGGGQSQSLVEIDRDKIDGLLKQINQLTQPDDSNMKNVIRETYNTLVGFEALKIDDVLAGVKKSVYSLAEELGKASPNISIDSGDVFVKREVHNVLNDIFMHVFRNSIDHGIESVAEREEKGKPAAGSIQLNTQVGDDLVVFEVGDDGRGLALQKIYEKGIENGLVSATDRPSDQEIAGLIFSSGFSTAQALTEVSGRGVGMDAAREFIEKQGGSIKVELDSQSDDGQAFRAFKTQVALPRKFIVSAPSYLKTA